VNVLLRFWDYEEGQILLGAHDLHDYNQTDIWSLFGVMTQRTHLFNTTIRENIHIARMEASLEEVEAAARQAQIHDFILSLPDGYNTYVGEDGARLSGGERQRIALARVLLKNSPFLILDEATANLDAETEHAIMETLLQVTTDQSLLILTHRHIFLDQMDQIYMIHNRQLVPYRTSIPAC
jgi:ATP-binding cassette, subfamily C, bacterial CydC